MFMILMSHFNIFLQFIQEIQMVLIWVKEEVQFFQLAVFFYFFFFFPFLSFLFVPPLNIKWLAVQCLSVIEGNAYWPPVTSGERTGYFHSFTLFASFSFDWKELFIVSSLKLDIVMMDLEDHPFEIVMMKEELMEYFQRY